VFRIAHVAPELVSGTHVALSTVRRLVCSMEHLQRAAYHLVHGLLPRPQATALRLGASEYVWLLEMYKAKIFLQLLKLPPL
jgi:hypothetical protein